MTQPTPAAPSAEEKQPTLSETIADLSGVDLAQIPNATLFITSPRDGQPGQHWLIGKPTPVKDELTIYALFFEDDQVRVYCWPNKAKDAKGAVVPPTRFTLSRSNDSLVQEWMAEDLFAEEVAGEYRDVHDNLAIHDLEDDEPRDDGLPGATIPSPSEGDANGDPDPS